MLKDARRTDMIWARHNAPYRERLLNHVGLTTFGDATLTVSAMHTSSVFRDPRLSRMAAFLGAIGIEMRAGTINVPTLFPGSLISRGSLVVDESILVAPGDALHEAAHIALSPPERRSTDFAFIKGANGGEELTTIAWSWAALLELDIEPEDVFHVSRHEQTPTLNHDLRLVLHSLRQHRPSFEPAAIC